MHDRHHAGANPKARIDRRKHDEDYAERVIGGARLERVPAERSVSEANRPEIAVIRDDSEGLERIQHLLRAIRFHSAGTKEEILTAAERLMPSARKN